MKFIVRTHHFVKHTSASQKGNSYPAEIRTNDVSRNASALHSMDPKIGIRSLIRSSSGSIIWIQKPAFTASQGAAHCSIMNLTKFSAFSVFAPSPRIPHT